MIISILQDNYGTEAVAATSVPHSRDRHVQCVVYLAWQVLRLQCKRTNNMLSRRWKVLRNKYEEMATMTLIATFHVLHKSVETRAVATWPRQTWLPSVMTRP